MCNVICSDLGYDPESIPGKSRLQLARRIFAINMAGTIRAQKNTSSKGKYVETKKIDAKMQLVKDVFDRLQII